MKSLIFTAASSQDIIRTPGGAGNRRTFSLSLWIKLTSTGVRHTIFGGTGTVGSGDLFGEVQADGTLTIFSSTDGAWNLQTVEAITDTTTWHHILWAYDTTQATAANRCKIYLDGVECTYGVTTRAAQNYDTNWNTAGEHHIGGRTDNQFFTNARLADIYFVNAVQLVPSDFTSGTGASIKAIRYTGALGTNGFWLTFENASSTTTLGLDDGGGDPGGAAGSNDWTLVGMTTANSSPVAPPVQISPARADLLLSTAAPTVSIQQSGISLSPARVDLALSAVAPSVVVNFNRSPARVDLVLSSTVPDAGIFLYLFPDADSVDGGWKDQSGGTSLFAAIDEAVVDDADYIVSPPNPVNDTCKIGVSDPTVWQPGSPFKIMYRYKKDGTAQMDITARLLEGSTEIAAWTHTDVPASFSTATQTLSAGEFASIVDPSNLFLEFKANSP